MISLGALKAGAVGVGAAAYGYVSNLDWLTIVGGFVSLLAGLWQLVFYYQKWKDERQERKEKRAEHLARQRLLNLKLKKAKNG